LRLAAAYARRAAEAAATMPSFCASVSLRAALEPDDALSRVRSALREGEAVNGAWRDGSLRAYEDVRVAVALPGPVFPTLNEPFASLAARDPESFTAAEVAGATFTVWGLGLSLDWLTPLLMPRQSGALGVGRAGLTLVCDARALTPADADRFLSRLADPSGHS
jgi:pyruvate/2-oxoglutarate dehydrogenase complex dihydrolipoamide acyltransferase (E2) component